ncbi:hypothetical protein F4779DRAFT_619267 [Xylariaceae sp. FL0662B]|nr:hypothetical protein F4779DRAFT_619267 [Xylariaceae sp. FL0662B]
MKTFEGLIGYGAFGLTFGLVEKLSANRARRLAVKRSSQPQREGDLRNEIEWLTDSSRGRTYREDTVMIGEAVGRFQEHDLIPPLKFIDFGCSREGFTRIMISLIARQQVRVLAWITTYQGFETGGTEILYHASGNKYPTLDGDLLDFLARCLAGEERDRHSLSTMLRIAKDAVCTKTAAAFPGDDG